MAKNTRVNSDNCLKCTNYTNCKDTSRYTNFTNKIKHIEASNKMKIRAFITIECSNYDEM